MNMRNPFGSEAEPDPETPSVAADGTSETDSDDGGEPPADVVASQVGRSEGLRRASAEIEALPVDERRFVAGYAYVLARVAHSDREVSDAELEFMERALTDVGQLARGQAALIVEVARIMAVLYGATEDFVITREFARSATADQRESLLRTAFAVSAADGYISEAEDTELDEIGKELGFRAQEVEAMREEFRDGHGGSH